MDLWLIAATAVTEYITKHLHNVSKGKEDFSESPSEVLTNVKLESPRGLASKMARVKKPKEENFEDCLSGGNLDLYECGNAYGLEVALSNEEDLGNSVEIRSGSFGNRAFLRRNRHLIKPSEDVNFFRLQDLLGLSDEEKEEDDEMEKHLIKQIVEKTKQGSSAVFNAQKILFLMEEIEPESVESINSNSHCF